MHTCHHLSAIPNHVLSFAMEIVLHWSVDRHPKPSASHSDLALLWSKAHLGESGPVEARRAEQLGTLMLEGL